MFKIAVLLLALVAGIEAIRPGGLYRPPPPKPNFCQGCRSIVSYLTTFNSTEHKSQYKDVFRNFCEQYYPVSTDFQQGPCPLFVESLFHLFERIDPVHHCDQIGACGMVSYDLPELTTSLGLPDRVGNPICDFCEQIVEQVQGNLEDPRFIDQLHKQVDAMCDFLKVVDQDQVCKQAIDKYLDQAIEFVRTIKPDQYCSSVHLCKADQTKLKKDPIPTLVDFSDFGLETSVDIGNKRVKDLGTQPSSGIHAPTCMLCKTVVKEMFHFLRDNRTVENIEEGLDQICSLVFPKGQKRDDCDEMVASYTKEMVDLLTQETDPELVCILLELCRYRVEQPEQPKQLPEPEEQGEPLTLSQFINLLDPSIEVGSIKSCLECKLIIKYLQDTLNDQHSREEVKEWLLTNLCGSLEMKSMQQSCVQIVNSHADVFIRAIAKEINPEATCKELGACHNKMARYFGSLHEPLKSVVATTLSPKRPPTIEIKPTSAICDQCVEIVANIDEYLSTHPVDHDVATLIDQVCNKIPQDSIKDECTTLVKILGDDIAQAIANMHNPKQLCSDILLC